MFTKACKNISKESKITLKPLSTYIWIVSSIWSCLWREVSCGIYFFFPTVLHVRPFWKNPNLVNPVLHERDGKFDSTFMRSQKSQNSFVKPVVMGQGWLWLLLYAQPWSRATRQLLGSLLRVGVEFIIKRKSSHVVYYLPHQSAGAHFCKVPSGEMHAGLPLFGETF